MYKGSNAEKLNSMSLYDLLCRMNDKSMQGFLCVLQMLDYNERVRTRCDNFGKFDDLSTCRKCIADWLNEPHD